MKSDVDKHAASLRKNPEERIAQLHSDDSLKSRN